MNATNIKRLRCSPPARRLLLALHCLLATLVISQSVGCAPKLSEAPSSTAEADAAGANDTIESAKPTVDFDSIAKATRDSGGNIVQLDFRGREVSDEMISEACGLSTLKVLKLSGKDSEVTPTAKSLQQIGKLKNLKVLALDFLPVDDETVKAFSGLNQLKELLLAGTQLTDDSAETIAGLKTLTKVRVARTKITNASLEKLATLPSVADLDASECEGIDDDSAASIGKWKKLTKLNLFGTSVGNGLTEQISGLNSLRSLNLDRTK